MYLGTLSLDEFFAIREARANKADPRTFKNIFRDITAPFSQDTLKRKIHNDQIKYYQRLCEFESKIDLVEDKKVLITINKFFKRIAKDDLVATRLPNIEFLMDMVDSSLAIETTCTKCEPNFLTES